MTCLLAGEETGRKITDAHETGDPRNYGSGDSLDQKAVGAGPSHADVARPSTWVEEGPNGEFIGKSEMGKDLFNNSRGVMCCRAKQRSKGKTADGTTYKKLAEKCANCCAIRRCGLSSHYFGVDGKLE